MAQGVPVSKRGWTNWNFDYGTVFCLFVIFPCCVWCIRLVWFCSWNAGPFRTSMELAEGIVRGDGEDREGTAQHHWYVGSIFFFEENLIWIPNLRDFRCLRFDLRKMVANAECSRQDMVLLWRKMARGRDALRQAEKYDFCLELVSMEGREDYMLGFYSKILPVFHGAGWKDWFTRCKKADDSVPHIQRLPARSSGSKGSWCVAV